MPIVQPNPLNITVMMQPATILVQRKSSCEARAILHAANIESNRIEVIRLDGSDLGKYQSGLSGSTFLPVGDVPFMRRAFAVAGIPVPAPMSYPERLRHLLRRRVVQSTLDQAWRTTHPVFLKPVDTKLFTGYVLDHSNPDNADEHQAEQFAILSGYPRDTPVWLSDVVHFVSEWRFYVQGGHIIGEARYDADGPEHTPGPNRFIVSTAIVDMGVSHPYTMDFGVLEDGHTALVECNDAWAIGLYGFALAPSAYLNFLWERWQSLLNRGA